MKTRALIAAFAFSAIVLGTGSAFAYNGYGHGTMHNGSGYGMMDSSTLSPEKQSAYEAMLKDHYNRVSPLQDKLDAKELELNALSRNSNAKPETISSLAKEVTDLRAQLRTERVALGDRMEKELGVQPDNMMRGGMGYHHGGGRGHGGHGGQGGYGNCGY